MVQLSTEHTADAEQQCEAPTAQQEPAFKDGHITAASPSGGKAEDGQSSAFSRVPPEVFCKTQLREQLLIQL